MTAYFNEFDPYAAQWLRNLISAGHLPAGDVDERSIRDVAADDLAGYTQCHFFAGAVDGPHRRDRLWIAARRGALADTAGEGPQGIRAEWSARQGQERPTIERDSQRVFDGDVADTDQPCASEEWEQPGREFARACGDSGACNGTSPWSGHQWIIGHDGKARRIPGPESGIRLLAHGVPARVGRLRAYGNAIVPTLGAQVIAALMECAP